MKSRSYYMRQKGPGILLALQLAHARETCHAWNLLPLPAPPYTADVMTGVQGASTKRAAGRVLISGAGARMRTRGATSGVTGTSSRPLTCVPLLHRTRTWSCWVIRSLHSSSGPGRRAFLPLQIVLLLNSDSTGGSGACRVVVMAALCANQRLRVSPTWSSPKASTLPHQTLGAARVLPVSDASQLRLGSM